MVFAPALLAGCAAMPMANTLRSVPADPIPAPVVDKGWRDIAGVMHIHTVYSDGSGTFEDLGRIANNQKLDFLITADHDTLEPLRDGQQGWRGTTLILVGTELTTQGGHLLALNIKEEINGKTLGTQQVIDAVRRQGGLCFINHPFAKRKWTAWDVKGFTGMEIYNAKHDALEENKRRLALWTLASPPIPFYFSLLDRPYDPLAQWDRWLAEGRRVVGVGGADAHEYRFLGFAFGPYEVLLRMVRTHLLIKGETTPEAIYDALKHGRAYVAHELTAEADGFTFTARRNGGVPVVMGESLPFAEDITMEVRSPEAATLILYRDGQPWAQETGLYLRRKITAPGVYRVETVRHDKPWIYTNPIFISAPEPMPAAPNPRQP